MPQFAVWVDHRHSEFEGLVPGHLTVSGTSAADVAAQVHGQWEAALDGASLRIGIQLLGAGPQQTEYFLVGGNCPCRSRRE